MVPSGASSLRFEQYKLSQKRSREAAVAKASLEGKVFEAQGILYKRSRYGTWLRRYFRLEGRRLSYSTNLEDGLTRGELDLQMVEDLETEGRVLTLKQVGGWTLVLRAPTVAEAMQWATTLQKRVGGPANAPEGAPTDAAPAVGAPVAVIAPVGAATVPGRDRAASAHRVSFARDVDHDVDDVSESSDDEDTRELRRASFEHTPGEHASAGEHVSINFAPHEGAAPRDAAPSEAPVSINFAPHDAAAPGDAAPSEAPVSRRVSRDPSPGRAEATAKRPLDEAKKRPLDESEEAPFEQRRKRSMDANDPFAHASADAGDAGDVHALVEVVHASASASVDDAWASVEDADVAHASADFGDASASVDDASAEVAHASADVDDAPPPPASPQPASLPFQQRNVVPIDVLPIKARAFEHESDNDNYWMCLIGLTSLYAADDEAHDHDDDDDMYADVNCGC